MAGLKTLQRERLEAVKTIREQADILERTRDPERAIAAGREIVQATGSGIERIATIDREGPEAWAELDRMSGPDIC